MDAADLQHIQSNILRCNVVVRLLIEECSAILGDKGAAPLPLPSPSRSLGGASGIAAIMAAGLHSQQATPRIQHIATLSKHQYPIQFITVANNHREVWSADASGAIKIWDSEKNAFLREIETHQENIFSILGDEDKLWLASAQSLQVWNPVTGALISELSSEPAYSLLKVGRNIWSGGSGSVHIYDAKTMAYQVLTNFENEF